MRVVCFMALLLGSLQARVIEEDESVRFELPFPEICLVSNPFCDLEWEPMFPNGEPAPELRLDLERENMVSIGVASGASENLPEPTTWLLIGTGLSGLAFYRRRRR